MVASILSAHAEGTALNRIASDLGTHHKTVSRIIGGVPPSWRQTYRRAEHPHSQAAHGRRRRGDPRTPLAPSVQSIVVRAVARAWGLRPLATVWVVGEKHDREKLIDVALDLCRRQGYEATTIDQIAAGGVTSQVVRYFASKDAIILSIVDDIVGAVATELAHIPPQTSRLQALLAANTAVISDIANGAGVIPP